MVAVLSPPFPFLSLYFPSLPSDSEMTLEWCIKLCLLTDCCSKTVVPVLVMLTGLAMHACTR